MVTAAGAQGHGGHQEGEAGSHHIVLLLLLLLDWKMSGVILLLSIFYTKWEWETLASFEIVRLNYGIFIWFSYLFCKYIQTKSTCIEDQFLYILCRFVCREKSLIYSQFVPPRLQIPSSNLKVRQAAVLAQSMAQLVVELRKETLY